MWRFIQISDPHLGSQLDGVWNNGFLCSMMPDVMRCLKRDLADRSIDFILVTGDIASNKSSDAVFAARDLLDSLGYPYFPMGGNHDFVIEESRQWFLEAFHAHLPEKSTFYSFTHKNLHLCVLDPWWKWSDGTLSEVSEETVAARQHLDLTGARWAVPPHQLEWLAEDLKKHRELATIVTTHFPAVPIPKRLHHPGMRDGGCLDNGSELTQLLREFPQVKAIFSGHAHVHYIESNNGLTHVTTGALPEYPTEYREVQVFDDRLEVTTKGLSDTSFAARSLIPGNGWTAGEAQDRSTTIALV
jgi:3',5'-cyclic AMP phosphodiesterase CpdA